MNAAASRIAFSGFTPRVFLFEIAKVLQSVDLASILQQIHYWLENPRSGKWHHGLKWTYNTYEEWQEQFPWLSVHMVARLIRHLERLGLVISANLNRTRFYRRKWYTLDYQKILELTGWNPHSLEPNQRHHCADLHDRSCESATPLLNSLKITSIQQHDDSLSPDNCCLPPPPQTDTVAQAPPCQGQAPSAFASLTLDTEPPPALEASDHEGEGEELVSPPKKKNPQAAKILSAVSAVMPLNVQIQREVLKYTLAEVEAAVALYQTRTQKTPVKSVGGWLTDALRGRWAGSASDAAKIANANEARYPLELRRWYEWASSCGLVDGRPLGHLPHDTTGSAVFSPTAATLLVALAIPPGERHPWEGAYRYVRWPEAVRMHPFPE